VALFYTVAQAIFCSRKEKQRGKMNLSKRTPRRGLVTCRRLPHTHPTPPPHSDTGRTDCTDPTTPPHLPHHTPHPHHIYPTHSGDSGGRASDLECPATTHTSHALLHTATPHTHACHTHTHTHHTLHTHTPHTHTHTHCHTPHHTTHHTHYTHTPHTSRAAASRTAQQGTTSGRYTSLHARSTRCAPYCSPTRSFVVEHSNTTAARNRH